MASVGAGLGEIGWEVPGPAAAVENILIIDRNCRAVNGMARVLAEQLPTVNVLAVPSLEEFRRAVQQHAADVVVLDQDLWGAYGVETLMELRLKDHEPFIVVVSSVSDPQHVASLYNAGCHRCIVKQGAWLDELGPAVRHLLRLRKLEVENAKLIAKLTEANVLLAEKNKRLDEFSGTVAHDIRGPLGGINMKLEYLCDTYPCPDERFKKLLGSTLNSTRHLLGLVQAMYEFAKLGSKAARMSEVNLPQLIEEVANDLHFDDALNINVEIGQLPQVWGSPDLLRKVFINLLSNAVKYNDKPDVNISVMPVCVIERSLGRFCRFKVEDNGRGIPKQDLRDIFSMFRRGSNVDQGCEGIGVGLAVVKRVIELHFGQIEVSSEVGRGTAFTISLPMDKIELEK
jgi:signal transduction histidine kinase